MQTYLFCGTAGDIIPVGMTLGFFLGQFLASRTLENVLAAERYQSGETNRDYTALAKALPPLWFLACNALKTLCCSEEGMQGLDALNIEFNGHFRSTPLSSKRKVSKMSTYCFLLLLRALYSNPVGFCLL